MKRKKLPLYEKVANSLVNTDELGVFTEYEIAARAFGNEYGPYTKNYLVTRVRNNWYHITAYLLDKFNVAILPKKRSTNKSGKNKEPKHSTWRNVGFFKVCPQNRLLVAEYLEQVYENKELAKDAYDKLIEVCKEHKIELEESYVHD